MGRQRMLNFPAESFCSSVQGEFCKNSKAELFIQVYTVATQLLRPFLLSRNLLRILLSRNSRLQAWMKLEGSEDSTLA